MINTAERRFNFYITIETYNFKYHDKDKEIEDMINIIISKTHIYLYLHMLSKTNNKLDTIYTEILIAKCFFILNEEKSRKIIEKDKWYYYTRIVKFEEEIKKFSKGLLESISSIEDLEDAYQLALDDPLAFKLSYS